MSNPVISKNKVYFSQNREDLILESFFLDVKNGFYVDVGAYDPVQDSVTKIFYDKGWHGINIEPQIEHFNKFELERKRDINLNIGISSKPGELVLREYKNGGLSTFNEEVKLANTKDTPPGENNAYVDRSVKVDTLENVFKTQKVKHIEFMKVDVEGLEYDVLSGNDWNKYRPDVLCIEKNHIIKDWRQLLKKHMYELVFDDGLNEYYQDKKSVRKGKFDYVGNVVLKKDGGIRYEIAELLDRLNSQILSQDDQLVRCEDNIKTLTEDLARYRGIKYTFRHLIKLVVRKFKG